MTSPDAPIPRARPLTKVVLPAPSGPLRRTRSPRRTWRANRAAAASVSSGDLVITSREPAWRRRGAGWWGLREVIVATFLHFKLAALSVHQHHSSVRRQLAHPVQPRRKRRPAADELHLLAVGHRVLGRRPFG